MVLFSEEAEREVLAAAMSDKEVVPDITEQLKATDFYTATNQLIYSKVLALYTHSKDISPISVYEAMAIDKDKVSLHDLMKITESTASTKAFQTYADIVKDFSNKRKIQTVCNEALRDLESKPSKKLLEDISNNVYSIAESKTKDDIADDEVLMTETLDYIQEACQTKGASIGMRTGWKTFDIAVGGFERGNMTVIAGRSSMGKTAFTLQLMEQFAAKGYRSLLFELEMNRTSLGLRRVASNSNLSMQKIKNGNITSDEMSRIMYEADKAAKNKRILTDVTAGISLLEIRNKVRRIKASEGGLDFVIVDHIGLMKAEKSENRNLEISSITAGLKVLAKTYDVSVIVIWQLNREVERRADHRPMLSDLRDSGAGEQDSDAVLFVYRDAYYSREKEIQERDLQDLELILAKNRNGKTGTINFEYSMKTQRIWEGENG